MSESSGLFAYYGVSCFLFCSIPPKQLFDDYCEELEDRLKEAKEKLKKQLKVRLNPMIGPFHIHGRVSSYTCAYAYTTTAIISSATILAHSTHSHRHMCAHVLHPSSSLHMPFLSIVVCVSVALCRISTWRSQLKTRWISLWRSSLQWMAWLTLV